MDWVPLSALLNTKMSSLACSVLWFLGWLRFFFYLIAVWYVRMLGSLTACLLAALPRHPTPNELGWLVNLLFIPLQFAACLYAHLSLLLYNTPKHQVWGGFFEWSMHVWFVFNSVRTTISRVRTKSTTARPLADRQQSTTTTTARPARTRSTSVPIQAHRQSTSNGNLVLSAGHLMLPHHMSAMP